MDDTDKKVIIVVLSHKATGEAINSTLFMLLIFLLSLIKKAKRGKASFTRMHTISHMFILLHS